MTSDSSQPSPIETTGSGSRTRVSGAIAGPASPSGAPSARRAAAGENTSRPWNVRGRHVVSDVVDAHIGSDACDHPAARGGETVECAVIGGEADPSIAAHGGRRYCPGTLCVRQVAWRVARRLAQLIDATCDLHRTPAGCRLRRPAASGPARGADRVRRLLPLR